MSRLLSFEDWYERNLDYLHDDYLYYISNSKQYDLSDIVFWFEGADTQAGLERERKKAQSSFDGWLESRYADYCGGPEHDD